ncbi:MAG: hypothetical protein RRC34_06570 [Lentisphaeria bacterium]|nr:hypothetical protein [Lentisphaeria bacterium]
MKLFKTISVLFLLAALAFPCRGEYAPVREDVINLQKIAFQGKKPEEIARFLIRTALTVMETSDCSINQETLAVANTFWRGSSCDAAREAIPIVASHLLNKVNSGDSPIRKAAWFVVASHEIGLLEKYWDEEVENMPDVVPALCRAVVRLPYSEGINIRARLRERTKALLERCGTLSADKIRKWAEKESAWLDSVSDEDLRSVTTCLSNKRLSTDELRKKCRQSIDNLLALADTLKNRKNRPTGMNGTNQVNPKEIMDKNINFKKS